MELAPTDVVVQRELLGAARDYFLRFGYSRVSTGEIAASCGRSKKTLYRLFPSKEQLLLAVLADINRESEEQLLSTLADQELPLRERLQRVLVRFAVHSASLAGTLDADLRSKEPTLWQQAEGERRGHLLDLLVRVLTEAPVRRDVDLRLVLDGFLSGVERQAEALAASPDRPERLFSDTVTVLVDGLLVQA